MARFNEIVGNSYAINNKKYDSQRTVNFYLEVDETGKGKDSSVAQLVRTPGSTTLSTNAAKGLNIYSASNGKLYIVREDGLYSFNNISQSETKLYSIALNEYAQCADNGIQLCVVSNGIGFFYNMVTAEITIIDAIKPSSVTYYDGYIIFSEKGTNKFWWTDLYSTNINRLNFASAEANPDEIVGVFAHNEDLWIFGKNTTEIWYNAGSGNVVFARRQGILIETGCYHISTLQKLDMNRFAWVASNNRGQLSVVSNGGQYGATRISTFFIEQKMQHHILQTTYPSIIDSATYQHEGHVFYVLSSQYWDTTLCYDITMTDFIQQHCWHERAQTTSGKYVRHHISKYQYFSGRLYGVGFTGNLYEVSNKILTDDGETIRRERVTPHVSSADGARIFYHALTIDVNVGIGTQILNPTIILQWSNDGGFTWSNEIEKQVGMVGAYASRVVFRQLGQARDRVFRIIVTDPVEWAITGGSIQASGELV